MKAFPTIPLFALTAALLSGCATSKQATYVDPNRTDKMVANVGQINIQDWTLAAETMTQSLIDDMINGGKLKSPSGEPAILAISRIVNGTTENVDINLLTKKIRIALNKTGRVVTTTTGGLGGAEDPLAKGNQQEQEFLSDKKVTRSSDYTLSGRIIEDRARQGNLRQSTYVFQLSLTGSGGLAVWEDEKTIVKQGKKSNVSF